MTSVRLKNELLLINLCSALLIAVISLVDNWVLRVVLGLPFLLFFPGYTLIAAVFPRKGDIGATERIALSVTFSVIISPVIGFILNFLWRIDLYPILVGITVFIAAMSVAAWFRRLTIAPEDRLEITFTSFLHGSRRFSALNGVVSIILLLVFVAAIVTLGYVVANPRQGERFTGFYLRGVQSRPTELTAGEAAVVTLGITNHELETLSYRIEIRVGESLVKTTDAISLQNGGEWEGEVSFVPNEVCARTELTQDVNVTDNASQAEVKSIQVASVANLAAGDDIWIGEEDAIVQQISGNNVALTEALHENHASGTEVQEVKRVEFSLLKIRKVGDQADTSLSLWVGKDHLKADLVNLGLAQASYGISLEIGETGQEGQKTIKSPVQDVATGGTWTQEFDYDFSENHEIKLSLNRNGQMAYQVLESGSYPSLFLWFHIE